MESKLDALVALIQGSEKRMSTDMQSIKGAMEALVPEIQAIKTSLGAPPAAAPPPVGTSPSGAPSLGARFGSDGKPSGARHRRPPTIGVGGDNPVLEVEEIKTNLDAWKPDMEARVGDLGEAVRDLRRQVDPIARGVGAGALGAPPAASPPPAGTSPSGAPSLGAHFGPDGHHGTSLHRGAVVEDSTPRPPTPVTECSVDHPNMVIPLFSWVPVSANAEDVAAQEQFEEMPPQIKFEGEAWSWRLQLKPPWPSFRFVSRDSGVSHPIWKSIAKDQHSTRKTWYYDDEFSSVKQCWSVIQGLQQVSAFLDIPFGFGSCATGITMHISDTCSVLKLLPTCSTHVLLIENFVEVGNILKCKEGMQYLFGEILVEVAVQKNARVCCFMRLSDKEEKHIGTIVDGACYSAWISKQEKKISYVVVVKYYYKPNHRSGHVRKELPRIDAVTWVDLGVLNYSSWCGLETWSPLVLLSYKYWLLLGHVHVLDKQLLGWFAIAVLSGCSTVVSESVFTEFQQLNLYKRMLNPVVETHLRGNPMELLTGAAASTRCGCAILQCIITGVPNYHHCSARRYQSCEDYCFLWVCEHVTRFSLELIHFVMATSHGKIVSNQGVRFSLFIHLKQLLGLPLFDLEPWNPSEQNLSSPHFNIVPACKCSTDQGGKNHMARATFYLDYDGQDYYRDTFSDLVHVGHDYYIAFVNKNSVGYDYYLDQVYYFDKVRCILILYHEDYHDDPDKIKGVRASWDPGKSALRYPLKTSAWGQAEFQEGRNVMTLDCIPQVGPASRAIDDRLSPNDPPGAKEITYTRLEATSKPSSGITMN